MKKILHTCIFAFCAVTILQAQSDPVFFQQSGHRDVFNPATTGKGGDINAALGIRQQWIGFPGPSTQAVLASGFVRQMRSGVGLSWRNDKFGPQKSQNVKLNYAYFVPFEEQAFLALGLGAGVLNHVYDGSGFDPDEEDDEMITKISESKLSPDFDFGMEFNTRYWEIGGSVTHLAYTYEDENLVKPLRNFYVYTRAKVPVNKYWDFIPGITWHNAQKLNTYEVNVAFRYNNNLCINLAYRNPMALGIALGIDIYRGVRFSYSFDYGIDGLSSYNDGSHEVWISYNIPVNTNYVRSKLRFFRWKMW